MKLYSGPLSLFTAKVRIALAEKSIPCERIEVPFSRAGYEPKHPVVVAHNPKAQVPVLIDGDLVLYDSTVIVEYLDDLVPDPPLLPADPAARARCRLLELHSDEVFFPRVLTLIREVFYKAEAERDAAAVAEAGHEILAHYRELDTMLADRTWIGARHLSAADVAYLLTILFASSLGEPVPESLTALRAWFARCSARPAIAAELEQIAEHAATLPT